MVIPSEKPGSVLLVLNASRKDLSPAAVIMSRPAFVFDNLT